MKSVKLVSTLNISWNEKRNTTPKQNHTLATVEVVHTVTIKSFTFPANNLDSDATNLGRRTDLTDNILEEKY